MPPNIIKVPNDFLSDGDMLDYLYPDIHIDPGILLLRLLLSQILHIAAAAALTKAFFLDLQVQAKCQT